MDKGRVIVIQFVTLDGVVEDPDGSGQTPGGGWAFRSGPKRVAADEYANAMNRIPKVVVSRSAPALDAWSNSSLLECELVAGVADLTREQDVVVGSTSVVHALTAADAVDEYRLLVDPDRARSG